MIISSMVGQSSRVACVSILLVCACASSESLPTMEPWRPGYLDIHHISVAADATFMIFPDGTTMLFDAGGSDKRAFEERAYPLKAASTRPDSNKRPGELYANYIAETLADAGLSKIIDYGAISHFHSDHYGLLSEESPLSENGNYKLTGITYVDELVPIGLIIDRAYPQYDYPVDLKEMPHYDGTFLNYIAFINSRELSGRGVAALDVGSTDQIVLRNDPEKYPAFSVRNVKSNGVIWSRESKEQRRTIFDASEIPVSNGRFNENPLSMALLVSYGPFDYFTGGDMTGLNDNTVPAWFDTETPVAAVVEEVDALALNHHGVRDATNATFADTLHPQVSIVHGRTSDHPGQEVTHRIGHIDQPHGLPSLFGTYIHDETITTYGPAMRDILAPEQGHVVIRVYSPGDRFEVFVVNDGRPGMAVLTKYGPYNSQD